MGFSEHDILSLSDAQVIEVLGTYLFHVASGRNFHNRTDLSVQSLRNYVHAAHRVLELWLRRKIPIYDESSMGKQQRFHPYIGQQLQDRRNWERKKPQKLPMTRAIYEALHRFLLQGGDSIAHFVGVEYCVYDWLRLGAFTGFRPSEYAQTKVGKGQQFLAIPDNPDVPEDQRGKPIAFVAEDVTFYTRDEVLIPHAHLMVYHRKGLVHFLQLRWRFDKSTANFVLRKYAVTEDPIFNPVDAAVNIIFRSQLLQIPADQPIGVWKNATGRRPFRFLRDSAITKVMRLACELAYPNPDHFYRRHITSLVPHSVRVTAAYVMQLGGADNDEIAHSKRWLDPKSVPTYNRDGFVSANVGQTKTLRGLDATAGF